MLDCGRNGGGWYQTLLPVQWGYVFVTTRMQNTCITPAKIRKKYMMNLNWMEFLHAISFIESYVFLDPHWQTWLICLYGYLTRYVQLRVTHAPGMPRTFTRHRLQRQPLVSDPVMYHGTCATHVPQWMSGSLIHGGGETFPAFPAHTQPAIYVSGKRPILRAVAIKDIPPILILNFTLVKSQLSVTYISVS